MLNAEDPEVRRVRGEDFEGTDKSIYFTFRAKHVEPHIVKISDESLRAGFELVFGRVEEP